MTVWDHFDTEHPSLGVEPVEFFDWKLQDLQKKVTNHLAPEPQSHWDVKRSGVQAAGLHFYTLKPQTYTRYYF